MSKLSQSKKEGKARKKNMKKNPNNNKVKNVTKTAGEVEKQISKKKKRRYRGKKHKTDQDKSDKNSSALPPNLKKLQKENISSNWKTLMQNISKPRRPKSSAATDISPFKRLKLSDSEKKESGKSVTVSEKSEEIWFDDVDESLLEITSKQSIKIETDKILVQEKNFKGITKIIGLDCEMVGVGKGGTDSILGRVSLVNHFGHIIYDSFVAPTDTVTDYRTNVSGIRPTDLSDAPQFKDVQTKVAETIKGKILVGHAIHNDLKVLFLSHPRKLIRDTSTYKPFRAQFDGKTPGLKKLIEHYIGVSVQSGEHSSVQDAQAAVRLYTLVKKEWETSINEKKKKRFASMKSDTKKDKSDE